MNIFFNSRINANQSLLNVLFGQQQISGCTSSCIRSSSALPEAVFFFNQKTPRFLRGN